MNERSYPIKQIMVALLTCLVMIAAAFAVTKTEVRAAENWAAFNVYFEADVDVAKPNEKVNFDIKITNTTKKTLTIDYLGHWYSPEWFGSDDLISFGTLKDSKGNKVTTGNASKIKFSPKETKKYTLSGTLPKTWNNNKKSAIVVVTHSEVGKNDYYGQYEWPHLYSCDDSCQKHFKTTDLEKATTETNGYITQYCPVCGNVLTTTLYPPKSVSFAKVAYNGKNRRPVVTIKDKKGKKISSSNYTVTYPKKAANPGKYTAKITFINRYSGSLSRSFTISPKKVTSLKATKGKKKMLLRWKKDSRATGYQIVYAQNSKFTKGKKTITLKKNTTVKQTIRKLKSNKTYYVKVRAYKKVDTTNIYGPYSTVKKVKVR